MLFLLALIKGGVVDPVAQMSRTQDRMYNNKAFQKPDVDINNEEQQDAAVKIQTKYRQHQSKAVVDQMRQDKAATKIQAGIRGHLGRRRVTHLRKQVASSSHGSFNAVEDGNDLEELAQEDGFNINDYDREETARTQGSIEMTPRVTALPATPAEAVQPGSNETEEIDIDLGDPEVQKAAVFIQSGFRGLKSRRKPAPSSSPPQPTPPAPSSSSPQPTPQSTPLLPSPIPPPSPAITPASTQMDSMTATPPPPPAAAPQPDGKETEEIDIDLGDPEVQKAAAFIQSGFRGLKARRKPAPSSPQPQPTPPPPPSPPPATIETNAISKVGSDDATVRKSPANEDAEDDGFDLNDPGVQSAATKIQAGFRGMRTRQNLKPRQKVESTDDIEGDLTTRTEEEGENERQETPNSKREMSGVLGEEDEEGAEIELNEDDPETIKAIEEIQAGFRRLKAEAENEDEDEVVEMSNEREKSEMEAAAATKIQAGFKGMKIRQELKGRKVEKKAINEDPKEIQPEEEETDAGNLSSEENSDAELRVAANKIQAGFRGYKTRKEVQRMRRKKGEELASHSQGEFNGEREAEEKFENGEDDEGKRVMAAGKIQAGFKGYKTRREVEILRKEKAKVSEKNEEGSEDEGKRVVAASKIQAGFKGYKTRREVEILRKEKAKVGEKNEEGSEDEGKRVVAARKIQAGFRGYKTRKEVEILQKEKAKVGEKNEDEEEIQEDEDA